MITYWDNFTYGAPQTIGLGGILTWSSELVLLIQHRILEAYYAEHGKLVNRVQVFGDGVFTEDWDWEQIALIYDQLDQDHDMALTTTTKAHARGDALLRAAEIQALSGYILVPLNCGQELYDVVTITDQRAGVSLAKRRVVSLDHVFIPAKGTYALRIGLGDV